MSYSFACSDSSFVVLDQANLRYSRIVILAMNCKASSKQHFMKRRLWNDEEFPKQHIHLQVCAWTPPPTSFILGHQCLLNTSCMVPATKLMISWYLIIS